MGVKQICDPSESVILIKSHDDRTTGTGFVIHHEEDDTWILTCAHVVEDAGGAAKVRIKLGKDTRPAELVGNLCGSRDTIDLALLKVSKLDVPVLSLSFDGKKDDRFQIPGFAEMDGKFAGEPVNGKLGDQFPLETEGPRVRAWQLRVTGDISLQPGYSGSPVVCTDTLEVLAVTTHEQYKGERGYAIHIAHLRDIYGDLLPKDLLRDDSPLPWKLRNQLKQLIQDMGVNTNQMRMFCNLALPLGGTFAVPSDLEVDDLIDWIADWGGGEDWVPLLSVARQLHKLAREPRRSNLKRWVEQAAQHFGVIKIWNLPITHTEKDTENAAQSPVLLVEIIDRTSSRGVYRIRFFYCTVGRLIEVESGRGAIQFKSSSAAAESAVAEIINRLMYEYFIDREQVFVEFILPDELLRYSVEHWAYDEDGIKYPLGAVFPVMVRPNSRQYSGEFDPLWQDWQQGWNRQFRYRTKRLCDALCWIDASQRKRVITRPTQGYVCIGLRFIPTESDFLRFLVKHGITAAIWPQRGAGLDRFCEEIEQKLSDFRVEELPRAVHALRRMLWTDDDITHPGNYLSLLWDDPRCCLPSRRPNRNEDYFPGVD